MSNILGALPPIPAPTSTNTPTPITGDNKCQIFYDLDAWSNGYIAEMYTLSWDFGGDDQLIDTWNATFTQTGQSVTASNTAAHWNGTIDPYGG